MDAKEQLKAQWQEKRNSLFQVHRAIKEIDARLKSIGLAIWDAIGLAPNEVKDDKELYLLPVAKLSKKDLLHKKTLLNYKKEEIEAELRAIQAQAKQMQADELARHHEQYDQHIKIQSEKILSQYQANPNIFFAEALFDPLVDWSKETTEIYRRASMIMAVCQYFSMQTDENHLWQAWRVVARARDIEIENNEASRIYTIGAENFFAKMLELLPAEMHGLKMLYDEKYYDRVDHYLNEYYGAQANSEDESYEELLTELVDELDNLSMKTSLKLLANTPRFRRLPRKIKEQIIREHTYVTKSKFYLSLIDDETWRGYVKTIEDNITSVINKRMKLAIAQQQFDQVREQIAKYIQSKIRLVQDEVEQYRKEA